MIASGAGAPRAARVRERSWGWGPVPNSLRAGRGAASAPRENRPGASWREQCSDAVAWRRDVSTSTLPSARHLRAGLPRGVIHPGGPQALDLEEHRELAFADP